MNTTDVAIDSIDAMNQEAIENGANPFQPPKTVFYFVTRDSATAWRDEDRAMAHAKIAKTDTLAEAQAELGDYIKREVEWLIGRTYRTPEGLRRAADLLAIDVRAMQPDENKSWDAANVIAAGLVWSITRVER